MVVVDSSTGSMSSANRSSSPRDCANSSIFDVIKYAAGQSREKAVLCCVVGKSCGGFNCGGVELHVIHLGIALVFLIRTPLGSIRRHPEVKIYLYSLCSSINVTVNPNEYFSIILMSVSWPESESVRNVRQIQNCVHIEIKRQYTTPGPSARLRAPRRSSRV